MYEKDFQKAFDISQLTLVPYQRTVITEAKAMNRDSLPGDTQGTGAQRCLFEMLPVNHSHIFAATD